MGWISFPPEGFGEGQVFFPLISQGKLSWPGYSLTAHDGRNGPLPPSLCDPELPQIQDGLCPADCP